MKLRDIYLTEYTATFDWRKHKAGEKTPGPGDKSKKNKIQNKRRMAAAKEEQEADKKSEE